MSTPFPDVTTCLKGADPFGGNVVLRSAQGVLLLMTHLLLESLACSVATFIDNLEIELTGSVKSPLALLNPPPLYPLPPGAGKLFIGQALWTDLRGVS